jgi:ABC-2 type transport system permease protein
MKAELVRQLGRRRTLGGLVGIAAVPVVLAIAFSLAGNGDGGGNGPPDPAGLFDLATASGLNFALMSTAAASQFLLLTVVALFTGDTVSSEASWGSLRYLLTRPVPRRRLLARKLAVGALLSLVAAVLLPVSGLVTGTLAYGWGDLQTPLGALAASEALARMVVIVAYVAWSSAWVAAVAFAWSTTTDSSVGAVAGTIVVVIVVQILDAISALGDLRQLLPVHELTAWVALLGPEPRYGELTRGIVLQVPYLVAGVGFAAWWFERKDILS